MTRDWSTDFDHADVEYNANAPEIWADLRGKCPIAHTEAYGGTWLPTRHEDVHAIAYDTEHFSSVGVVVSNGETDWSQAPLGAAPPITSDPPVHGIARRLLLPAFAPKVINPWEGEIREMCNRLIDDIEAKTQDGETFDAAVDYAQNIPVYVIALMLGMPLEDADTFRVFVHDVLEAIDVTPEERAERFGRLSEYITAHVEQYKENPKDDLTGYLLSCEFGGQPLAMEHIVGSIILLLVAGIDTTWSAIGSSIYHLAGHPTDLARLVDDPDAMPFAIEELLRAYAPVTMARVVSEDVEIGGVQMKRGDWTLLPFPAANLDPEVFENADQVDFDRVENRHAAFGLGIHRCLGSNLARLELRVAVEEFVKRFRSFELAGDVRWSVGQVRGPRELPVRAYRA
jgi:cytochrome P450